MGRDMTPASKRLSIYTLVILDKHNRQIDSAVLPPLKKDDAYKRLLKELKILERDPLVAGGYLLFQRFED